LQEHPNRERAYLQLLNLMLYEGKASKAKTYFLESAAYPKRRNYCLWMLAKISAIQDSLRSANRLFRQAILHSTPPLKMLNDYAGFLHENGQHYDGVAEIKNLKLSPSLENAALAFLYRRRMQFEKAIELLRHEDDNNSVILHVLGYCYTKIKNRTKAELYFQRGLRVARNRRDLKFEIYNLIALGILARQRDELDEEAEKFNQALSIATRINDLSMLHLVKGSLGTLRLEQKKYAESLQTYREAIKIAKSLGLSRAAAQHYRGKAQALFALGEFNDVLLALDQNEKYAQKSNDVGEIYSHLLERGKFYAHLNLKSLAEHEYEEAYKLGKSEALQHVRYIGETRYADLLVEQGKYQRARERYLEFLGSEADEAGPVYKAYWQFKIAESYYSQAKYDSAHEEFLQAQSLIEPLHKSAYAEYLMANTRLKLAAIETHRGNFAEAKAIYHEDIIARVAKEKTDLAVDLNYGLGTVYEELQEISEALYHYKIAVEVIEKGRKNLQVEQFRIGYFSKHLAPYEALIRCYLTQYEKNGRYPDLDTLFYYMEMSRSRSLQDLRVNDDLEEKKESPQYRSYKLANKHLESIQREIRHAPTKFDTLYPRYEAARYQLISTRLRLLEQYKQKSHSITPLDSALSDLKQTGMGLLFYHVSDKTSFALAANDQEIKTIRLNITPDSLKTLINELLLPFYRLSESSLDSIPFHADIAYNLYEILIKPVEQQFRLKDRLMLVPDHALRRLPFELLLMKQSAKDIYFPTDSTRYREDFLLQRYTFLYSPTTLLTKRLDKESNPPSSILVLANPANPNPLHSDHTQKKSYRANWRFAPNLYYADSEGDSIRAVYPQTKILKRNQATVAAFERRAPQHDILHFATHAFVDTVFDAFSGLVLATSQDSTDDGLLMGYEIAELHLNCELATLSACETGRGRLVQGEGILGLPRQFIRAGARKVLMTLWQVSDQFTLSLMPKFYEAFLSDAFSKPDALKEAKLTMLGKSRMDLLEKRLYYQHPFFWAPFSLYGTPDAPQESPNEIPIRIIISAGILLVIGLALSLWYYVKYRKS